MLIGLVAQLQKFVDELIGTVEGLLSFNGETPPPCSNGSPAATRRRGAKEKAETRELAEFAKPHVAKGLGWGEIRDLFIKDHPTKARKYADVPEGHEWEADHKRKLADKIKNAYFSKYPAT